MEMHANTFGPITAKMKMADLLSNYNVLVNLLPRLNIALGFGEKTVQQVCEDKGTSLPLFLLVCNVYTQDDYLPDVDELKQCPMLDVVNYLKASHKDYLEYEFPHIEKHLREVVQDWNDKYKLPLTNFFAEYKKEVVCHFQYEEEVIFPYIHDLIHHTLPQNNAYKMDVFDEQHSNIEDKLRDFTNLLIKYISADVAQRERIYMLKDIFMLSDDIEKHAMIEEKILIPYIKALETDENV